jgi:hypothetical protein
MNLNLEKFNTDFRIETLENYGIVWGKLPSQIFDNLKLQVQDIKNNFESFIPSNGLLAGNIEKEFFLKSHSREFELYILKMAEFFMNSYSNFYYDVKGIQFMQPWVNFMKKHEVNPIHKHNPKTGLSYVIWLKIPYNPDEEKNRPGVINSTLPVSSSFSFLYNDILGELTNKTISPNKDWEGTIVMFPSKLMHIVYPFYTSDEYRISIAGNITLS